MKKIVRHIIILVALMTLTFSKAKAQVDTVFWFAASWVTPDHAGNLPMAFHFSTFNNPTTIRLRQPASTYDTTFIVPANALFTDTVFTHPSSHPISRVTGLQIALNAKQGTLTAGTHITIPGNTISTLANATQALVTANFLNPSNPGTVAVTAGLSSTMTPNTLIASVDQNFDRRNLFILQDANNVL